jgi:hypothetical protein
MTFWRTPPGLASYPDGSAYGKRHDRVLDASAGTGLAVLESYQN